MARTDTLGHFLTDVATAIKTKKGDQTAIQASSFDTEITNLPSGGKYTPRAISFYGYTGAELDDEIDNLDTSDMTSMAYMFNGCNNLTSLDLSDLDFSGITSTNNMFNNCSKLETVTFPTNIDTSELTNMSNMFSGCSKINNVDLSDFDTSDVTTFSNTFRNCTSLTNVDLTNLDTSSATTVSNMFNGCSNIEEIDFSSFTANSLTTYNFMFNGCSKLKKLKLGELKTSPTYTNMFQNCSALEEVEIGTTDVGGTGLINNQLLAIGTTLKKLSVNNFNTANPRIGNSNYLTNVYINTISNATSLQSTFSGLPYITSLDLSNWDFSNITTMNGMFYGNSRLTSITFPNNINTSSLTGSALNNTFSDCNNLTSIDLSGFDLSNINSLNTTFIRCYRLASLTFPASIENAQLTDLGYAFNRCSDLTSVDFTKFNTTNVTSMSNMFSSTNNLDDTTLNEVLRMCIDATGISAANRTLSYLGMTSYASRIPNLSNYQAFINAGWSLS